MEFRILRMDEITPNPLQPREAFDREKLKEMADTIQDRGVLQPIVVRPKGKQYEIIAGERRWKASQIAGMKEIPAIIKNIPDSEVMIESLIENIHREDLNPTERGKAYLEVFKVQEKYVFDVDLKKASLINKTLPAKIMTIRIKGAKTEEERFIFDICHKIGKKLDDIGDCLAIVMKLSPLLQRQAKEKEIGDATVLERISSLEDEELQARVFDRMVDEKLKREEISQIVTILKKASEPVKEAVLKEGTRITPEVAKTIMEIEHAEEQDAVIRAIEHRKLVGEDAQKFTETVKQAPEPVREAMLKPKSRITPEIAKEIMTLEKEGEQRSIITQIETLRLDEGEVRILIERQKADIAPKLSEEDWKNIEYKYQQLQDELNAKFNTPEVKERGFYFRNWLAHISFYANLRSSFCPHCGRQHTGKLTWNCCGLGVEEAYSRAKEGLDKTKKA